MGRIVLGILLGAFGYKFREPLKEAGMEAGKKGWSAFEKHFLAQED